MAKSYYKFILSTDVITKTLEYSPAGYQDFEVEYVRHEVYGTIFRKIGGSIRFVKDGYKFLNSLFFADGINAKCNIEIQKLDMISHIYKPFFVGIIDFTTFHKDIDFIEVSILDNSILQTFFTYEETKFNLLATKNVNGDTITAPTNAIITLPSINFTQYTIAETITSVALNDPLDNTPVTAEPTTVDTDINILGSQYNDANARLTVADSTKDIQFKVKGTMILKGTLSVDSGTPVELTLELREKKNDTVIKSFTDTVTAGHSTTYDETFTVDYDVTRTMNVGDEQNVYIYFRTNGSTDGNRSLQSKFTASDHEYIYTENKSPVPSNCYGITIFDAFNQLLKIMDIPSTLTSDLFGSGAEFENLILTTGKKIRQFPIKTAINVSIRDLFIEMKKLTGARLYIDESDAKINKVSTFFNNSLTGLTINELSQLESSNAEKYFFTDVKTGYKSYSYDAINGLIEFNVTSNFITNVKNTKNSGNYIMEWRADTVGIELTRRMNHVATGSTDTDADEHIFLINCKPSSGKYVPRLAADVGIVSGQYGIDNFLNLDITPRSFLDRNSWDFLTAQKYDSNNELTFISSKNNIDLTINGVSELSGGFTGTDSVKPLFVEFETYLTSALITFLATPTAQTFKVKYLEDGIYKYGFLDNVKVNYYTKTVSIKLIKTT